MAAEVAARGGVAVTVYERMPTVGRKFLLAGRGGLNLTHSEDLAAFLKRYGAAEPGLRAAIEAFPPEALRAWCEALGQATFVGSSGRVFPRSMKTSPLLRAWLRRLDAAGVSFKLRHRWMGWDEEGCLLFDTPQGQTTVSADATVLALGGASWPHLGSDGAWVDRNERSGCRRHAVAAGKLRVRGSMVGHFSHALRRTAAETSGAVVRRSKGARRGPRHRDRLGRRWRLRTVGGAARGDCRYRRGDSAHRLAPRPDACRSGRASRRAAREAVAFDVLCARPRTCRRSRSACCRRRPRRRRNTWRAWRPLHWRISSRRCRFA